MQELTPFLTDCSTLEAWAHALTGQHSGAGPEGMRTGEQTLPPADGITERARPAEPKLQDLHDTGQYPERDPVRIEY